MTEYTSLHEVSGTSVTAPVDYANDFVDYMNASVSQFHCVAEVRRRLLGAGFVQLDERKVWSLEKAGKYFVTRNGSSIISFAVGGQFDPTTSAFMIIGGHTDSPVPVLKPTSKLMKEEHVMLGVVGYGGGIWRSWFDRDLTVVGRALVKTSEGRVEHRLVRVNKALCVIPSLAIHLSVGDERTTFKPNLQNEFPPLMATAVKESLWRSARSAAEGGSSSKNSSISNRHTPLVVFAVAQSLGCAVDDIVDFELQLCATQPAALVGVCDEFISSGRLDNQGTCYTATTALIESLSRTGELANESSVRMVSLFDHEEVGSASAQGAESPFFNDVMTRISTSLGADILSIKQRSFQISSDMAHAVHPNYSARHDPMHKCIMHGGLVIKHNANQRYATNCVGASLVREFARIAEVPIQEFAVRADSACGSTIGPITATQTGIRTVDVGPPQLAMHSCRELMGADDVGNSIRVFVAAFRNFSELNKSLEVDLVGQPDPFWSEPGNGWGQKTQDC
eukprot:CAMPEP_0185755974 /NCGR_PEP_ID=MMETSP1174-20130828/14436_1 /TAXON_ID=35687 /ORGANISM="Dictyocha speculum, Strain CCMP1381" /LENGTH=507 /DNA_ID=CAMNT_0028434747 /DNA_START=6 /DNA_END=1529 /DNA_ORIENTATION=+